MIESIPYVEYHNPCLTTPAVQYHHAERLNAGQTAWKEQRPASSNELPGSTKALVGNGHSLFS